MNLKLLDGKIIIAKEKENGFDVAKSLSSSLSKIAIAYKLNGQLYDLRTEIKEDGAFEIITKDSEIGLEILRHSSAHLLAHAVSNLYPDSLLAFGPAIEEGFFYDILFKETLTSADFPAIEKEMKKLVDANIKIERVEVSKDEAKKIFSKQKYKLMHIDEIEGQLTVYKQGDFYDLCMGPHVPSTSYIAAFKILSLAGAYFHNDIKNEQLTRIYGTSFYAKSELEQHLINIEERKKRDHRKIGKELDLFMISDYGPGFPFWLPNGMILRQCIEDYWYRVHTEAGYQFCKTPIMLSKELWEVSGHWYNYRENMYTTSIDERDFVIKPMNCPGGILVYKNSLHSYKDLPIRLGELGLVHRHEASGALSGLFRVRTFTQDDAHIFLREDQLQDEILALLHLYDKMYRVFGLTYNIVLSTRPEDKYIGTIESWDKSEAALAGALKAANVNYKINPGDGAFYGPKLDFKLKDSMGKIWQCGTIQLDCNLPERFEVTYIDSNGEKVRPLMLHRALYGSIERFIGILIEHFAGAFPVWMAPLQVKILPVSPVEHLEYANFVAQELRAEGVRVVVDERNEKLGYRLRDAAVNKVPYTLVLGGDEVEQNTVNYRKLKDEKQTSISRQEFIKQILKEIKEQSL